MPGTLTIWLIALAFFIPMHYLGPVAVLFLTGNESPELRRRRLRALMIDCTLTIVIAFPFAAWLFEHSPLYAGLLFLGMKALPYLHLLRLRQRPAGVTALPNGNGAER